MSAADIAAAMRAAEDEGDAAAAAAVEREAAAEMDEFVKVGRGPWWGRRTLCVLLQGLALCWRCACAVCFWFLSAFVVAA